MFAAVLAVCALTFSGPANAMYAKDQRSCRTDGCVTQYGCVPRYSQYSTALYCAQRCVIERCRSIENEQPRRVCQQITSVATGQVLAAVDSYDRRGNQRYASLVNPGSGGRDRWNMIVGPGNYYYIQNSDTREYLRASDDNYLYLVSERPTDESFLFKPDLVQGRWSCVLLQSVCYRSYIFAEQQNGGYGNFAQMTRDLQQCYRDSLWSISTVNC
uniref:23.4 kDa salivary protein n=1 Tax=Anopheles stephensi TaxID=30069 RepID=A0A182Y8H8_ANOST